MLALPSFHTCSRRHREQGGIVIMVALMLLMLLSVAAFSLSRTVIREIGISGNVYQAGRADAASDAGLDWFVAWENDSQQDTPTVTPTGQAKLFVDAVQNVINVSIDKSTRADTLIWHSSTASPDGMVLQGQNTDGSVSQAFNLQVVCLGPDDQATGDYTGRGQPSGGTDQKNITDQYYGWEAVSTGQSLLPGDPWRFQSIRAAKVLIRPK